MESNETQHTSPGTNKPMVFTTDKKLVETAYDKLTQSEKDRVNEYRSRLNLFETNSVAEFGVEATSKISHASKSLIDGAKTKDLGEASTLLLDMKDEIQNFDKKVSGNAIVRFFESSTNKIKRYKSSYDSVSSVLEGIKDKMANSLNDINEKVKLFEEMYNENIETQQDIMLYVIAAEQEVLDAYVKVEELYKLINDENPTNPQLHSEYLNYTLLVSQIEMLQRRIDAMKVSRHMINTTQPQILMMQKSAAMVNEKLRMAASTTIPAWHQQVSITIGIDSIARTSAMMDEFDKATDNLIKNNSKALNMASVQLAKSQNSSLDRLNTLKQVNKDTQKALDEIRKITEDAMTNRVKAEKEMIELEAQLNSVTIPKVSLSSEQIKKKIEESKK